MQSTTFTIVVIALAVLAVAGTLISGIAIYRSIRREKAARRSNRSAPAPRPRSA